MEQVNLIAAWIGILLGFLSGAVIGLGFSSDAFLGGYGCWRRRLVRLGHISLFGIALINVAFVLTVRTVEPASGVHAPSVLLLVGAVGMPLVCFLSAWRRPIRHLFFVPVLSLLAAAVLVIVFCCKS